MFSDKILIVGNGYIGSYLSHHLSKKHKIAIINRHNFKDIEQGTADFKPQVIIYTVKLGSLSDYEANPQLISESASLFNQVVELTKKHRAYLINFSSSFIFGDGQPYRREWQPPFPLSNFGRSMLKNEELTPAGSVTLRTSGVYGNSDKNSDTMNWDIWAFRQWAQAKPVYGFSNVFTTPTFIGDILSTVEMMIQKRTPGIYNVVGSERCTRYEFFLRLGSFLGVNCSLILPAEDTCHYRPRETSLSNLKLSELGIKFMSLGEGFEKADYRGERN